MTIADFVQQVYYAIYKVRLDTTYDAELPEAFHADSDKFKEVVMEANFVLQELQKEQDWNWLRIRLELGEAVCLPDHGIMEFKLPEWVYKVATGYNDAVRLHNQQNQNAYIEVPFTSPRSGNTHTVAMFDEMARPNVPDYRLLAFVVDDTLTFNRPFGYSERGLIIETDVIRLFTPLHICDADCVQPCSKVYVDKVFTEITDPYYMVVRTAARRAEGDPSVPDRAMALAEEGMKVLSAMRSHDTAKTFPDTYATSELGYVRVL